MFSVSPFGFPARNLGPYLPSSDMHFIQQLHLYLELSGRRTEKKVAGNSFTHTLQTINSLIREYVAPPLEFWVSGASAATPWRPLFHSSSLKERVSPRVLSVPMSTYGFLAGGIQRRIKKVNSSPIQRHSKFWSYPPACLLLFTVQSLPVATLRRFSSCSILSGARTWKLFFKEEFHWIKA